MGFRVVDKSSFTFETDLPPSCRNIHPSGILHAFPSITTTPTNNSHGHGGNNSSRDREEHAFAWITNSLHVESAITHFETAFGFDRSQGIVFLPYSTKRNWLDRYPHAAPILECLENGKVIDYSYLNWRPYPNQVAANVNANDDDPSAAGIAGVAHCLESGTANNVSNNNSNDTTTAAAATAMVKDKKRKSRAINMIQDSAFLPDAERDELHIEIYNYLSWLHAKLDQIEKKATVAASAAATSTYTNTAIEDEVGEGDHEKKKAASATSRPKNNNGVDVSELQSVLDKLESAFSVIPNVKSEAIADKQKEKGALATTTTKQKGAPFLEEALKPALSQSVAARELAGKPKRRSRKRQRHSRSSGGRPKITGEVFDGMFQRLVRYKEEHGDCQVSKNYKEDVQLANWVRGIRERKAKLLRNGIEVEEAPPAGMPPLLPRTCTAERIEKLNSIGFAWILAAPMVAWEDRFRDLMEYYEKNDRWPSQSMGSLGEWVHKQRGLYARNDKNYMKNKAPKLDEVGFEWTPRGNTKMSWDEGFEMLMEYGRINEDFDVPCPVSTTTSLEANNEENGKSVDRKSDAFRLYKWVESLHVMYRSYKLGRQSGSLSDERVVLLIKHGFVFRND